jgi:hypothetical protein
MEKMKLTPDQLVLLQSANAIETEKGIYYNFPYWIKKNGEDNMYEIYTRAEIPGVGAGYKSGGIKNKYIIQKTDGSTIDPNNWYFLLNCYKDVNAQCSAMKYADFVEEENHILAEELRKKIREFNPNIDEILRAKSNTQH